MKTLRSSTTLLLLLLSIAGTACAETVGRVILSAGEVTALRQGRSVPLGLGAEVESGDRIRTGQASNAQIRFTDSAIVALRPDSDFGIDEYVYQGEQNGRERGLFSLFKGGLRTITGFIGKINQRNYAVHTPTATVGIRGTHFNLVHCANDCKNTDGSIAPDGTYGGVSDGRVAVTPLNAAPSPVAGNTTPGVLLYAAANTSRFDINTLAGPETVAGEPAIMAQAPGGGINGGVGERVFGAGEYFRVPDANTPAQQLLAPPGFLTDKLEGQVRARPGSTGTTTASTNNGTSSGGSNTATGSTTTSPSSSSDTTVDARAQETATAPTPLAFISTEVKSSSGGSSVLSSNVTGFFLEYPMSPNSLNYFVVGDCRPTTTCGSSQAQTFTFNGNYLTSYAAPNFQGSLGGGTVVDSGLTTIAGTQFGWGRWTGNFTVTDPGGTSTGATLKSGVLFAFTTDPTVGSNAGPTLPTTGSVSYVLVGGPSPVDTAGNVGTMTNMTGSVNFLTRNVGLNMDLQINIPTQGVATMSLSGNGTIPALTDKLIAAPLSGSCVGAGCVGTGAIGQFDARFGGTAAQVMVVNGGVTGAVRDQALGSGLPRSVLFLDVLKCSGC